MVVYGHRRTPPEDAHPCDWARGIATNGLIQLALKPAMSPLWRLSVQPEARVMVIDSLAAAVDFTGRHSLAQTPWPASMLAGPGIALTSLRTDWAGALAGLDAIQLTASAADEIAEAKFARGIDCAFSTWNCESTLWSRWRFGEVRPF